MTSPAALASNGGSLRLPQINPRLMELDKMRQRTQRVRSDFFARRSEPEFVGRYSTVRAGAEAPDTGLYDAISKRQKRFLKPSHIQNPDPCLADIKYYTGVTLRESKTESEFNALNRNSVPLPEWNTRRPDSGQYKKVLLSEWEDQIVKKPPPKMTYSLPMRVLTPQVHDDGADWNATIRTMFRAVDRFDVPPREYKVDREWVSENDQISRVRAEKLMRSKVQ